ncbi:MAG: S8 family serine peptidase [Bacteroidota bacterium]
MNRLLRICMLGLLLPSLLYGQNGKGLISPELTDYAQQNPSKNLSLGIMLKDRLNILALYQRWKKTKPTLAKRNAYLINQLQLHANRSQAEVLTQLNQMEEVSDIQAFWLANVIFCQIEAVHLDLLKELHGVEQIFLEGELVLDALEEEGGHAASAPGGREKGLEIIGAPEMWKMGYTGYGTKVLNIDNGVMKDHPSLVSSYWGLQVDKSQAWFDPTADRYEPGNCGWHGSHTLGIIVGLDRQTNDTSGVAFDANWMASDAICDGRSTRDIIATFQWALNPDGDSTTSRDIPDVINNSWTDLNLINECQNILYPDVFLALEASGIGLVFSAGNMGPNTATITPPKNIAIDEVNTFAVGVINGNSSLLNLIAFSGRGPSGCNPAGNLSIKPEVVAPGFQVRSAHTDGGYRFRSGTSMAAPHVSGAMLLLKQAYPYLPGYELKEALYRSAIDLGATGEDNDYGNGLINLPAAFQYLSSRGNFAVQPSKTVDLALGTELDLPDGLCGDELSLVVPVINKGQEIIEGFTLNYELDGINRTTLWIGEVAVGDTQWVPLPTFALAPGVHRIDINLSTNSGSQSEYFLTDNHTARQFYTFPSGIPLVEDVLVCEGSDLVLTADPLGFGEVIWFEREEAPIPLREGSRVWLGPVGSNREVFPAVVAHMTGNPPLPQVFSTVLGNDSSLIMNFDVRRPCQLNEVTVQALEAGFRTFLLTNAEDSVIAESKLWIERGTQRVKLGWRMGPGTDYHIGLRGKINLLRLESGQDYPIELDGVLRINGGSGGYGSVNYLFDWDVSYEIPCSRRSMDITVLDFPFQTDFQLLPAQTSYLIEDSIAFVPTGAPSTSWEWDFGDGTFAQGQEVRHAYPDSGQYDVVLMATSKAGCVDAHRESILIKDIATPIPTPEQPTWLIYPNPTSGTAYLKPPKGVSSLQLNIISLQGKYLSIQEVQLEKGLFILDMKDFPAGTYFLEWVYEGQRVVKRIVHQAR